MKIIGDVLFIRKYRLIEWNKRSGLFYNHTRFGKDKMTEAGESAKFY
jgi:hypothetical protein